MFRRLMRVLSLIRKADSQPGSQDADTNHLDYSIDDQSPPPNSQHGLQVARHGYLPPVEHHDDDPDSAIRSDVSRSQHFPGRYDRVQPLNGDVTDDVDRQERRRQRRERRNRRYHRHEQQETPEGSAGATNGDAVHQSTDD